MKAEIKDGKLIIELAIHEPRPSSTGKMMLIASSNGFKETELLINGKPVRILVNAGIGR